MPQDVNIFTGIIAAVGGISIYALIKVVRIFLRHIEAAEKRQEAFLGNHLSGNTAAMQAAARAQEKVAERLERVEQAVSRGPVVKVENPDSVQVGE